MAYPFHLLFDLLFRSRNCYALLWAAPWQNTTNQRTNRLNCCIEIPTNCRPFDLWGDCDEQEREIQDQEPIKLFVGRFFSRNLRSWSRRISSCSSKHFQFMFLCLPVLWKSWNLASRATDEKPDIRGRILDGHPRNLSPRSDYVSIKSPLLAIWMYSFCKKDM